jgi:uncharacterized membrane protein YbhN (UPF0104 family)
MIWALPQVGVAERSAVSVAFLDRFVTYWSLILIGLPLYFWVLRRDIAANNEDAD